MFAWFFSGSVQLECVVVINVGYSFIAIGYLCLAAVFVIRLRSLWLGEEPRWMLPTMIAGMVWMTVMRMISIIGFEGDILMPALRHPHYPMCYSDITRGWRFIGWAGSAVFDVLIYGLTLYRVRQLSVSLSRNSAAIIRLRNFVWSSSTIYFAVSFSTNLATTLSLLVTRDVILQQLPAVFSALINSVIACRIVFHSDLFSEGKTSLLVIDPRSRDESETRKRERAREVMREIVPVDRGLGGSASGSLTARSRSAHRIPLDPLRPLQDDPLRPDQQLNSSDHMRRVDADGEPFSDRRGPRVASSLATKQSSETVATRVKMPFNPSSDGSLRSRCPLTGEVILPPRKSGQSSSIFDPHMEENTDDEDHSPHICPSALAAASQSGNRLIPRALRRNKDVQVQCPNLARQIAVDVTATTPAMEIKVDQVIAEQVAAAFPGLSQSLSSHETFSPYAGPPQPSCPLSGGTTSPCPLSTDATSSTRKSEQGSVPFQSHDQQDSDDDASPHICPSALAAASKKGNRFLPQALQKNKGAQIQCPKLARQIAVDVTAPTTTMQNSAIRAIAEQAQAVTAVGQTLGFASVQPHGTPDQNDFVPYIGPKPSCPLSRDAVSSPRRSEQNSVRERVQAIDDIDDDDDHDGPPHVCPSALAAASNKGSRFLPQALRKNKDVHIQCPKMARQVAVDVTAQTPAMDESAIRDCRASSRTHGGRSFRQPLFSPHAGAPE